MDEVDTLIGAHRMDVARIRPWRPIMTSSTVIPLVTFVGMCFLAIGNVLLFLSLQVVEVTTRYDDMCTNASSCIIPVTIPKKMEGNIFIHYKLTNFHQNNRHYLTSRSNSQLRGNYVDYDEMYMCKGARSINDSIDPNLWILPCGFMATSFFNDTYEWTNHNVANFSDSDISWKSDKERLFRPLSEEYTVGNKWLENSTSFPDGQTNEHFIVWMRGAAFPTFIKLYAKCKKCTIPAGNYNILVKNNYPTSIYGGTKSIVISTSTPIGGGNHFLPIAYISLGGVSIIIGITFLIMHLLYPRELGDMSAAI